MFDYLIVGAGFAGSVLAERLANGSGKRVLICDKRSHIGGNAYDHYNDEGILVHISRLIVCGGGGAVKETSGVCRGHMRSSCWSQVESSALMGYGGTPRGAVDVVYSFSGGGDGGNPVSGVVR